MLNQQQTHCRSRSDLGFTQNCVYSDIIRVDFFKFKQTLSEYNEILREKEENFKIEHKEDNEEYKLEVDEKII